MNLQEKRVRAKVAARMYYNAELLRRDADGRGRATDPARQAQAELIRLQAAAYEAVAADLLRDLTKDT